MMNVIRNNPGPFKSEKRGPGRPKTKKDIRLTESEQLFCDLLLQNLNKSGSNKMSQDQAYRIAFKNTKSSDNSVRVMSSHLKKRPALKKYMRERKQAAANRIEITISRVLQGLLRIAEFDPRKLYDEKGRPIPIHKLPDDIALAMSGFEVSTITKTLPSGKVKRTYFPKKIKSESRKGAWELLGSSLGMWSEAAAQGTAEDFVEDVRGFANSIGDAIPGGML